MDILGRPLFHLPCPCPFNEFFVVVKLVSVACYHRTPTHTMFLVFFFSPQQFMLNKQGTPKQPVGSGDVVTIKPTYKGFMFGTEAFP